jgi:hypothetical protein
MSSASSGVLFFHSLTLYAANLAMMALVWLLWRRTRLRGFLLIATGSALHVATGLVLNAIAPFPIGNMPFSRVETLDDLTRAHSFLTLYGSNIVSSLLIVIGAAMAIRARKKAASSFEGAR